MLRLRAGEPFAALLAEHGLSEADVADYLKQQGASHEAITLGGMSRAELETIGSDTASTAAPSTASLDLPPGPSPHQHILDKVLVGQPLTDADAMARNVVRYWMEEIGLTVSVDPIGNMVGRREGTDPALPPIMMGTSSALPIFRRKSSRRFMLLFSLRPVGPAR
mgnify:CR=1 FL=1